MADEEEADWQLRLHQQEGRDLAGVGPVPGPRDVGSGKANSVQGTLSEGMLCTADLLFKVACFVSEV